MNKIKKILVSQPKPTSDKSPYFDIADKYGVEMEFRPFIKVEGLTAKEFRQAKVSIADYTGVIFTSRAAVDHYFRLSEETRFNVPDTMRYFCTTESIAHYLQKYIVYRKRKISFADGTFNSLIELIVKHKEEKFLLALSEPHKPELPETLAKLKLPVDPVILARTVAADLDEFSPSDYDLLALYSPTDVKTLVAKFDSASLPPVAVFGDATLRTANHEGLVVVAAAPTPAAPSMVKAIDLLLDKLGRGEEPEPVAASDDPDKEEFIRSQQHKLLKKSRARRPSDASRK